MISAIELRPGLAALADWRAIYRGASVELDPIARADVEAGRAALAAILARNGSLPPNDLADASPSIAELVEKRGEPLSAGLIRLFVALKLGSLAQGVSGARWEVIEGLASFLSHDLLPVVPAGNPDDRLALSNLFGALTGTGEVLRHGHVQPAQKALSAAGVVPLTLNPRERRALLSGNQLSVAAALAGLFEAERVFQSALVAAALSAAAANNHPALHSRVHGLSRQAGQIDVAAALRELSQRGTMAASGEPAARSGSEAQTLGACLGLLRQAAATLTRAANAVSEDQLVLWQAEEIVDGTGDLSAVALAADQIALALRVVGDLSESRIEGLAAANVAAGPEGGMAGIEGKAAGFMAENRERALPTALDPHGIWRLLPMVGTTALVIAIEFLGATHALEGAPAKTSGGLEAVRRTVADAARPASDKGAVAASNLASVAVLVGSGALAGAAGVTLPSLNPPVSPERKHAR